MIGLTSGSTRVDLKEVAQALEAAGFDVDRWQSDGLDCVGIMGPNSNAVAVYEDGIVVVEGPHRFGIPFLVAANLATQGVVAWGMRKHAAEHTCTTGYVENADVIESMGPEFEKFLRDVGARNNANFREVVECLALGNFEVIDEGVAD